MTKEQVAALLKLMQAVVNAEVAMSWAGAQRADEHQELREAVNRTWASLRAALPLMPDPVAQAQLEQKAACWETVMRLAGHWQDGTAENVTFTQDEATRDCIVKHGVGKRGRKACGPSFANCLYELSK